MRSMLALVLSAALLFGFVPEGRACGPNFVAPIFVFEDSPDLPFAEYARGRIGIALSGQPVDSEAIGSRRRALVL